jgi:hypothetical protein
VYYFAKKSIYRNNVSKVLVVVMSQVLTVWWFCGKLLLGSQWLRWSTTQTQCTLCASVAMVPCLPQGRETTACVFGTWPGLWRNWIQKLTTMFLALSLCKFLFCQHLYCIVWISFARHVPNWRVAQIFHSLSQKTTGPKYRKGVSGSKGGGGGESPSPGWQVGLYFYSPSLNSTRIWQVGEWLSAHLYCLLWIWNGLLMSLRVLHTLISTSGMATPKDDVMTLVSATHIFAVVLGWVAETRQCFFFFFHNLKVVMS